MITAVFPHDNWDPEPWAYTTDFRPTTRVPRGKWIFAVKSSADVEQVSLRLEGPASILRKGKLRDLKTGKLVRFRKGVYTFDADSGERYFSFKLGKR